MKKTCKDFDNESLQVFLLTQVFVSNTCNDQSKLIFYGRYYRMSVVLLSNLLISETQSRISLPEQSIVMSAYFS